MYRDYYETDIEDDPENMYAEELISENAMLRDGNFNFKRLDFVCQDILETQESDLTDVVDEKIFKFKYRKANDYGELYNQRQKRVLERFLHRMENRDNMIDGDMTQLLQDNRVQTSMVAYALGEYEIENDAGVKSKPLRDYMVREAV